MVFQKMRGKTGGEEQRERICMLYLVQLKRTWYLQRELTVRVSEEAEKHERNKGSQVIEWCTCCGAAIGEN